MKLLLRTELNTNVHKVTDSGTHVFRVLVARTPR